METNTNTCEKCGVTGLFDNEIHPDAVECIGQWCYDCYHALVDAEVEACEKTEEYQRLLRVARWRTY